MLKIAICDDCIQDAMYVTSLLENEPFEKKIDTYTNGKDLLSVYEKTSFHIYDIIYLDIELINIQGIDLATKIREKSEDVLLIFTTCYPEYAIDSFVCSPFRYLVKPLVPELFSSVFKMASEKVTKNKKFFCFSEDRNQIQLCCNDILFFESFDHILLIHTKNGVHKVRSTLNVIKKQLDSHYFAQPHKSYLVNLYNVKKVLKDELEIEHPPNVFKISISRSYKKNFLIAYTLFSEGEYCI